MSRGDREKRRGCCEKKRNVVQCHIRFAREDAAQRMDPRGDTDYEKKDGDCLPGDGGFDAAFYRLCGLPH